MLAGRAFWIKSMVTRFFSLRRNDIAQDLLRSGERDDGSCQRSVGHQAGKSALEARARWT